MCHSISLQKLSKWQCSSRRLSEIYEALHKFIPGIQYPIPIPHLVSTTTIQRVFFFVCHIYNISYTHFVIYHMFGSIVCFRNQKHAHISHLFLMSIGKIVQKQPRSRPRILVINTFCSHRSQKNIQCPKRIPIGTLVFPPNNPRHQRVPKCSQHFCDRPHMTTRCHRADGSGAMMDTTGFQMDIGVLTYDTYVTYEYESHW